MASVGGCVALVQCPGFSSATCRGDQFLQVSLACEMEAVVGVVSSQFPDRGPQEARHRGRAAQRREEWRRGGRILKSWSCRFTDQCWETATSGGLHWCGGARSAVASSTFYILPQRGKGSDRALQELAFKQKPQEHVMMGHRGLPSGRRSYE